MFLNLWGCQLVSFSRTELTYRQREKKERCLVPCCLASDWPGAGLGFRVTVFSPEVREPFGWRLEYIWGGWRGVGGSPESQLSSVPQREVVFSEGQALDQAQKAQK